MGSLALIHSVNQGVKTPVFIWRVEKGSRWNNRRLGKRLARSADLYRNGTEGVGLIQIFKPGRTRTVSRAVDLAALITDRVTMRVEKEGKIVSEIPSAAILNTCLRSEVFLRQFRSVDRIFHYSIYTKGFELLEPGYHDLGSGNRILIIGCSPEIGSSIDTLNKFLDVMEFDTEADRTNTVAAALTVILRNLWPGAKPIVVITATRSHAGKGTIAEMIRGSSDKVDILYECLDWPMQAQFEKQVKAFPDAGVVNFDNVRLDSAGGKSRFIRSAFIESFVTNSEIILASPGSGDPVHLTNNFVTVLNTNDGRISEDLHNRSLPIHLAPKGSIHDRESPIGNPKLEFLPDNRHRIESELRGMIERWRSAGMPLDTTVKHPMRPWAQTVGGILLVSGFKGFLQNQRRRRTADNPITEALGILGASCPNQPLRPRDWASLVLKEGLEKDLISNNDRATERGRERGIGVILSRHVGETFLVTTETKTMLLRLDGGNRRWTLGENPHRRYLFQVLEEKVLEIDHTN